MENISPETDRLRIGPPLRLMGLTWVLMFIIYFLPSAFWAVALKIFLWIFVIVVVRAAFQPVWNRYATMGAFVTMQALWFAGLLWIPESFSFLRYIFSFLIVLGIFTKNAQIKKINEGLGPDLRKNI